MAWNKTRKLQMVDQINRRAEVAANNGGQTRSSLVVGTKTTNGNGEDRSARRSLQLASAMAKANGNGRGPAVSVGPPVGSGGGWGRGAAAMRGAAALRGSRGRFRGVVKGATGGPAVSLAGPPVKIMPKGFGGVVTSASAGKGWKKSTTRLKEMNHNVLDVTNTVTEIRHEMYAEHLLNALHADRNVDNCDVIIHTKEGTPIYAHSAILRQSNVYFKKNLNQSIFENGKYQVNLTQFSYYTFQDIIDYLYTGQFNIVNKKFLSLVHTLKELEMDDIIDQCMDKLKSSLTAANVFDILEETRQDLGMLTNVAMDFIEDNFKILCKSERINKLKWESVKQILSSDRLNVENEDKVYQMALSWTQTDAISRKIHVPELCQLIRIPYMTEFGLQNMICNKNVLTSNDEFFNDIETLLGNPTALRRQYYQRVNDKMGKIFVFGGYVNRSVIVNSMEVYSRSTGEWELTEDLNSSISCPRVYSASVTGMAKDNKIFIIGGQNEEGQRLDGILVFDGILSIWGSTKDMPTVRIRAAAAQLGRYLYVAGGQKDRHTLNEVIRYDIQRDTWGNSNPMLSARHSHGMTSTSSGLFVAGGDNGNGPIATAERYDKDTEQWTELSPMSNARFGCTLTSIKDQLYVIGGWNGRRALHECEKYNEAKNNWGYISPMNSRRYGHMSTVFASRIYVYGGQQMMNEDALNSMESYCSLTNTWTRCADMKRERAWGSSGSVL